MAMASDHESRFAWKINKDEAFVVEEVVFSGLIHDPHQSAFVEGAGHVVVRLIAIINYSVVAPTRSRNRCC